MENNPNVLQNEDNDALMFDRIAASLEGNINVIPPRYDFIILTNFILSKTKYDKLIISIAKCMTVYIKRGIQFCYEIVNKGIYNQMLQLYNPHEDNPKISIEVATAVRHFFMTFFSFDEMAYYRMKEFDYSIFIDKIFEFPLFEQKKFVEFTKNISMRFVNDKSSFSLAKVVQILCHPDIQIVSDCVTILMNCFNRGTSKLLKIVDPMVAENVTISLYVVKDVSLILILLRVLSKMCEISYEYAEKLVDIPIDFGLIINRFDNFYKEPSVEFVEIIIKIIKQIFSFSTLRKSDERNRKLSNFAFCVQPLLIRFIKQNLGDVNCVLECLLTTLDVYVPINEINEILDAIVFSITLNNKKIKSLDSFYKKLIENQKINDAMIQFEILKIQKKTVINHITDFELFIDASNLHSSSFALNETLQNSVIKILKNIKSQEHLKKSFSIENFELFKESLIKIVNICHKNMIFNTSKPKSKTREILNNEVQTQIQLTLFNQSGKTIFLEISSAMNFTICESFFNYMIPNTNQWKYSQFGGKIIEICQLLTTMNNVSELIKIETVGNDAKVGIINHALCHVWNNKIYDGPNANNCFRFYYFKCQGKIYSPFDNVYHAFLMSNNGLIELIEIKKNEKNLTGDDLMNREDIVHKYKNNEIIIKSDEFHISFTRAYPTLNLQKRAFNYYKKVTVPLIEKSLQIMKEIHRIFPNLKPQQEDTNNDSDDVIFGLFKNIFENEIFGLRLLESLNFKSIFNESSVICSTFINYPFLFPLNLRRLFLKLTALSLYQSTFTFIDEINLKEKKLLNMKQQVTLEIDKEKIFEEGLVVFNMLSAGSIFYDVKFKGENGFGRGTAQEFFRLFSLEMQRNKLDIWLTENGNDKEGFADRKSEKGLFPSPCAVHRPDLFFTLGSLCAKAIEMDFFLPFQFAPAFFKLIRGERIELDEISSFYAHTIENKSSLIGLPFTLPGREDIELRNGGKILVTEDGNVDIFIDLLRRVLTFDVFMKSKEEENFEKTEFSPLKPTTNSSNSWRNLHRTNPVNEENALHSSSSSFLSPNIKIRRAESASVQSSPQTHTKASLSRAASASFANNNGEGNEDESENIVLNNDENENDVDVPLEIQSYIERYSFECCASMFKEGFGRIIPWNAMNLFTPDEICFLIKGE